MTEEDVVKEAQRIITAAEERNITLRLLGGVAIGIACSSAKHRAITRAYPDIDLVGFKSQSRKIRDLLPTLGYEPNPMFNALRGGSRLMFTDSLRIRRIDIFLDYFEMCHKIDLRDRLTLDTLTLSTSDLLSTKLQVVKTNEKDFKDIVAIFLDHDVGSSDSAATLDGGHIARLCASDWGVYRTFTNVLKNATIMTEKFELSSEERTRVKERIKRLNDMIESEPKSLKWKARARIGEKAVWYKLPEEVGE
jgi:hypothetical protein